MQAGMDHRMLQQLPLLQAGMAAAMGGQAYTPGMPDLSSLPNTLAPTNIPLQPPPPPPTTTNTEDLLNQIFPSKFKPDVKLEQLRRAQQMFAAERDWEQFHTPRNLLMALVGEVGELAEVFQWKGEVPRELATFTSQEKAQVGEEMSDVLLYLIRLADVCGIDLGQAVLDKIQKNALKYPVDKCRGSAVKYTHFKKDKTPRIKVEHSSEDGDDESASKRKRFTDEQIEALTQVAESAGWTLTNLPGPERDRICDQLQIPKERLQNFFNNRKPKDLKKVRGPRQAHEHETSEGTGMSQQQQQHHAHHQHSQQASQQMLHAQQQVVQHAHHQLTGMPTLTPEHAMMAGLAHH